MAEKKQEIDIKKKLEDVESEQSYHSSSSSASRNQTTNKKKSTHHHPNKSKTLMLCDTIDMPKEDRDVLKETKQIMDSMKKRL
jgi:hypothetical protein